jgi:hypothetical protein
MSGLWLKRRLAAGQSSQGAVNLSVSQTAERSPRSKARIAGVFYLLTILTGPFAFFFRGRCARLCCSPRPGAISP